MSEQILLRVDIRYEHDVVQTRQRARQIAGALGFDNQDQTRLATAVSEIARNAFQYGGGGKAEFMLETHEPAGLLVIISDRGKGIERLDTILSGAYQSPTGMGLGIIGAKKLVDTFRITTTPSGVRVELGKQLPRGTPPITPSFIAGITKKLVERSPESPFQEMQEQNRELLRALDELKTRQSELAELNRELADTNRGVVALYGELDEKAESLRRANETKTRFLSNVTHEFRTPLHSSASLADMLLSRADGPLTEEQEKQVRLLKKSVQELSLLVNDLLDLAKVESGTIDLHPSTFALDELLGGIRGVFRPIVKDNRATELIVEEPSENPTLVTDQAKLAQILRNLISNAIKFTERGSVRLTSAVEQERVVFRVRDTGIGIPPADRERIFEEFTQVQSHLQSRVKGTGLGLSLSRKLAVLLGGALELEESIPNAGSTFVLSIPLSFLPGEKRGSLLVGENPFTQGPHPFVGHKPVVLIIDDDAASRYLLRSAFHASRVEVEEASGGMEGVQKSMEIRPQLIFLDLMMPDLSGFEVLAQLRSEPETGAIPVIVRSSRNLSSEERAQLENSTVAILPKAGSPSAERDDLRAALSFAGFDPNIVKGTVP